MSYITTLHYITADTVCTDLDNISPAIVSAIIRVEDLMSRMRDGITTRFKLSQYFIPLRCEHHFELENWRLKCFFNFPLISSDYTGVLEMVFYGTHNMTPYWK